MASHGKKTQYNFCTLCGGELSTGPYCPSCGEHVPCTYFARGYCRNGNNCPYAHPLSIVKKKTFKPERPHKSIRGGFGRRGRGGRGGVRKYRSPVRYHVPDTDEEYPSDDYYHRRDRYERKVPERRDPRSHGKTAPRRKKHTPKKSRSSGDRSKNESPRAEPSRKKQTARECREVGCDMYKKVIPNAQDGQKCKGTITETGQRCRKVLKSHQFVDRFFA